MKEIQREMSQIVSLARVSFEATGWTCWKETNSNIWTNINNIEITKKSEVSISGKETHQFDPAPSTPSVLSQVFVLPTLHIAGRQQERFHPGQVIQSARIGDLAVPRAALDCSTLATPGRGASRIPTHQLPTALPCEDCEGHCLYSKSQWIRLLTGGDPQWLSPRSWEFQWNDTLVDDLLHPLLNPLPPTQRWPILEWGDPNIKPKASFKGIRISGTLISVIFLLEFLLYKIHWNIANICWINDSPEGKSLVKRKAFSKIDV